MAEREKQQLRLDEDLAFLSKLEKKEAAESPKYLQLSPSLIELPGLDDPDKISIHDHTISMQASVRGIVGHALDNKISELGRENLSVTEIEDISRKWLKDWKDQHVFVKQEGRKDSNRFLEGEKVKAKSVEKYWQSNGLSNFEESVLLANLNEIKDKSAVFPQGIQRDANALVFPEASFTNLAKFKDERVIYTTRPDYLIYDQKQIIIIDNKFGMPQGDDESRELQALLYVLFSKKNLESLLEENPKNKQPLLDAHKQNLDNTLFYYRYLERGKNIFHYELYHPRNLNNPYIWGRFYEFLDYYRVNYKKLRELKKRRDSAFVLPYIRETAMDREEATLQTNMFGVIYESTS